jgi:hypothetical protein
MAEDDGWTIVHPPDSPRPAANASQRENVSSVQENNNQKMTMQGGDAQTWDESDQSKSNYAENSLVDGSQTKSRQYRGNAETRQDDQLGKQESQRSDGPTKSEQEKHGQTATLSEDEAATGHEKDTHTVTKSGNTSKKPETLSVARISEPLIYPQTPTDEKMVRDIQI